ncbi:hypothetical protein [Chondrinema litorale]|uniref:hypothetical protein n=1 Tax=Chondrinema litorale TaxID=2994555 RepID=UPI002543B14B|nr:hypothetical protein [Chondrinema litorale]UZR96918.1 hypothetical protein OQ292_24790 [Chondrinema litorale]
MLVYERIAFIISFISIGILGFSAVLNIAYFIIDKNQKRNDRNLAYLFYGAYCFNIICLIIRNLIIEKYFHLLDSQINTQYVACINLVLQSLPILFYSGFVLHFIDDVSESDKTKKWVRVFLKLVSVFLCLYLFVFFIGFVLSGGINNMLFGMLRYFPHLAVTIGFATIFILFTRVKGDLIAFIMISSINIATGAIISHIILKEVVKVSFENDIVSLVPGKITSLQPIFLIGVLIDVLIVFIAIFKRRRDISLSEFAISIPTVNQESTEKSTLDLPEENQVLNTTTINKIAEHRYLPKHKTGTDKPILVDKIMLIQGHKNMRNVFEIYWNDENRIIKKNLLDEENVSKVMQTLNDDYLFYAARAKDPIQIINRNYINQQKTQFIKDKRSWMVYMNDDKKILIPQNKRREFESWIKL